MPASAHNTPDSQPEATSPSPTCAPGWFPDPAGRAALRHWDGTAWTANVSNGTSVWRERGDSGRALTLTDVDALAFVTDVFVPRAYRQGMVSGPQANALTALADQMVEHVGGIASRAPALRAPALPAPAPPSAPMSAPAPVAHPLDGGLLPPASTHRGLAEGATRQQRDTSRATPRQPYVGPWEQPRTPRQPSAAALWWSHAKDTIGSELAVHGLAYLGVLLLFVGVFGLVAFAFGDVAPAMRPVAELAASAVPFLAARMLVGHGAQVAGRAMEVVGGLLLPLMLVTSMVDGFAFPPDVHGTPLAVSLSLGCAALAVAYGWWSRTHSDSGLRYAAAPTVWFGAAMATLAVGRPMPTGQDVAVPSTAQATTMAVALLITVAATRRWPSTPLGGPTRIAALPGMIVITVLASATWRTPGSGLVPVLLGGAALLVTGHLSRPQVPDAFLDVCGPLWWFLVAATLLADSPSVAALATVVGFGALLEVAGRRARPIGALLLAYAGLLAGLMGMLLTSAVWTAPVLAASAAWAGWRRTRRYATPGAHHLLGPLAAGLPIAAVVGLHSLTEGAAVLLAAAAALVVAGAVPAATRAVSGGPADRFWIHWWRIVLVATAGAGVLVWATTHGVDEWAGLGTIAVCAAAATFGPLGPVARPCVTAVFATTAWLGACDTGPVQGWVGGVVLGAAALTLVYVAQYPADGRPRRGQEGVALSGHAMAFVGVAVTTGWAFVATTALAVAGLVVTAWRDEHDRSVACSGAPELLRHLPWVGVAAGAQVLVSATGHLSGWVPGAWAGPLITTVALLYAAATRARLQVRAARVAPWASFTLMLVGLSLSWTPRAGIAALSGLVVAVALMARARRHPAMIWTAWVAPIPLAGLSSVQVWPWFAARPTSTEIGMTLVGSGAALLVGAALADLHGRPWTLRTTPAHPHLRAPAAVGAVSLIAGLVVAVLEVPYPQAQILTMGVAAVVLVVALVSRIGSLAGLAVLVAWGGVVSLPDVSLYAQPWIAIVTSTALLGAAMAVRRITVDRAAWSRWDVALLLAAAPVAATALHTAPHLVAGVFSVVGLQVVAVAIRLRRRAVLAEILGWTGTALITTGAGHAGVGWLALTLLALCVSHTSLAVVARPRVRAARQVIGVLAGISAWLVTLDWVTWSTQMTVEATTLGAAVLTLALLIVAARTSLDRSWGVVWGATLTTVSVGAMCLAPLASGYEARWPVVAALGCLALAAAAGAVPLRAPWLRDVSVGGFLATLVVALEVDRVPTSDRILTLSVVTVGVSVLALLVRGRSQQWDRMLAELGASAATLAVLLGLGGPADQKALVPAVAAAAVQVAATGVVLRTAALQALGPVLGCVAWLLLMSDIGARGPQWYTAAIGLALLAIVSLWRRDCRQQGQPLAAQEIVALELLGVAFLVGGPFAQAFTETVGYAFAATAIGIGLGLWGMSTRVRRRVATAAAVILASLVVVVVVPLAALLPAWGGAGMWITVAVLGLGAVMGATLLERAQKAAKATRGQVSAWTAGWE